jgi:hypothetical protein
LHESPDGTTLKFKEALAQLAKHLATILRTNELSEIEPGLSKRISNYLGGGASENLLRTAFGWTWNATTAAIFPWSRNRRSIYMYICVDTSLASASNSLKRILRSFSLRIRRSLGDLARPHEIVRLHRAGGAPLIRQVPENEHLDFQKTKQKVHRMGNEGMLLASHAILAEGQDDPGVIQVLFQTKGLVSEP